VSEAIVFDLDGLLVDSEPVWDQARRSMADEVGKPWTREDHHAVMGVSTREWAEYMIERLGLELTPEEVEAEIVGRMVAVYRGGIPYLPGAVAAVDLAVEHYPTALASGSHPALIEVVIVPADEVGAGKPAPDVYLATAERLGVRPEDCICVEDSGNGILAGVRAGMKVIAVPDSRFPPRAEALAQADLVLGSLTELTLESLAGLDS
jgi:HAD superfamily hydrolase (TIGR01509 family)